MRLQMLQAKRSISNASKKNIVPIDSKGKAIDADNLRKIIFKAEAFLITAGAGMGVDSGQPDFRGPEGFWKHYPPMKKLGLTFSQCAHPRHFEENPRFAWGFYGHRLNLYRKTKPHIGFDILKTLLGQSKEPGFVFTTNVDGQFQSAGFDRNAILEVHGSIHHLQGTRCGNGSIWSAKDTHIELNEETFEAYDPLPRVPGTGELARPNILMFNDYFWDSSRTDEQEMRFQEWKRRLKKNKTSKVVIFDIGSGTAIPTARLTAERITREFSEGCLIRINPYESEIPDSLHGFSISEGAFMGLSYLESILKG